MADQSFLRPSANQYLRVYTMHSPDSNQVIKENSLSLAYTVYIQTNTRWGSLDFNSLSLSLSLSLAYTVYIQTNTKWGLLGFNSSSHAFLDGKIA